MGNQKSPQPRSTAYHSIPQDPLVPNHVLSRLSGAVSVALKSILESFYSHESAGHRFTTRTPHSRLSEELAPKGRGVGNRKSPQTHSTAYHSTRQDTLVPNPVLSKLSGAISVVKTDFGIIRLALFCWTQLQHSTTPREAQ